MKQLTRYRIVFFVLCGVFFLACAGTLFLYVRSESRSGYSDSDPQYNKAYWEKTLRVEGGERAYASFLEKNTHAPITRQHLSIHVIGESLFDVFGFAGIRFCTDDFNFGCHHGFFARAIAAEGLGAITKLNQECVDSFGSSASRCRHGIGHGIMEYVGNTDVRKALDLCIISGQLDPMWGCSGGVFMAYNLPFVADEKGAYKTVPRTLIDASDPYAPCPSMSALFRSSCYHELPKWWRSVYNGEVEKMGGFCALISDSKDRRECFSGIGEVVPSLSGYDALKAIHFCRMMPSAWQSTCLTNTARAFTVRKDAEDAVRTICAEAESSDRSRCAMPDEPQ